MRKPFIVSLYSLVASYVALLMLDSMIFYGYYPGKFNLISMPVLGQVRYLISTLYYLSYIAFCILLCLVGFRKDQKPWLKNIMYRVRNLYLLITKDNKNTIFGSFLVFFIAGFWSPMLFPFLPINPGWLIAIVLITIMIVARYRASRI